VTPYLHSMCS